VVRPIASAGTVFVDVLPDLHRFRESLRRQIEQQTSGLKRQTEQLSQSFTRSFDDMGMSVDDTTTEVNEFGTEVQRSAQEAGRSFSRLSPTIGQVSEAQEDLVAANVKNTRAALGLKQAQQQLADVQRTSAGDADKLALAQLKVDEAQVRVSRSTREVDRAQQSFSRSMSDADQDTSGFSSSLSGISSRMSQFSGSIGGGSRGIQVFGGSLGLVKWPAFIQGANLAAAGISQLGAAAVGAVSSLAPLVGLLGAIPAGLTAVGGAVGTAALGFFGIGDALTAMGEQATASVPAVGSAGSAAADAGAQVAAAGRAVEAAQRGVADANRTVQDSERSLADSQRSVMYAQEALTDAREAARQTLRDLRDEVEGNVLSEKQAELSLAQARQRLREVQRDENATRLDIRQAALDVQQAEFDLSETREDNRENQKALNQAERDGVSGSEQVISARRALADANRGVADAERALAEAHRGVADAQRAVAEAQRGVTEAMQSGSTAAAGMSAEATALAESMAALSPAGREFVKVLFAMKPRLDALRATAQEGLLPGIGRAIQELGRELFPLLNKAVGETARTLGRLAERGAALLTSGPWKRDFATLLEGNSRLLTNFANVGFNLGDAFRHIAVAGQPLAFWLGRIAEKGSEALAAFFGDARRSGALAEFFERTRETTERLLSILGNLGQVFGDVILAGQDFGRWFLRQLDEITAGWAKFTGSVEGQNALKQWFEDAKPVLVALGRLIADVARMFGDMATSKGLPQLINQIRTQFLPVLADIFETSSGKLIPALVDLATAFAKVFKVFGTEHGFMVTFVKSLTAIFNVIGKITSASPALAATLATMGTFAGVVSALKFAGAITGISRVMSLVGGLGSGAATATTKVSLLARAVAGLGGPAAGTAGIAGMGLGGPIAAAMAVGAGTFRGLDILTDKLYRMGGVARDLSSAMRGALNVLTAGAFSGFNKLFDMGMELFGLKKAAKDSVPVGEKLKATWEGIRDKIKAVWEKVTDFVKDGMDAIKDSIKDGIETVKDFWNDRWDDIKRVLNDALEAIRRNVGDAFDAVKRIFGDSLDAIKRQWGDAWEAVKRALGNAWEAIKRVLGNGIDAVVNMMQNLPGRIVRGVGDLSSALYNKGKSLIKGLVKGIADAAGDIGSTVGDAVSDAMDAVGNAVDRVNPFGDGLGIEIGRAGDTPTQWFNALSKAVPGTQVITSGYRPGAITSSGNASLHSIAPPWNAVDIGGENLLPTAQAAVQAFGSKAREIIHTPLGFSIKNGVRVAPIAAADHYDHVHLADRGGVFKGPGMVGIGDITETVFQPARKVSELPQNGQMVARFRGPVKVDLVNGEAYFEEILLEHDKYQAYRGRAY
jgi:phage-related protein